MTVKTRITKLENIAGIGRKNKYMLVTGAEGAPFKIQPYTVEFGGTGEDPFELQTLDEVMEFGARPDVSLLILEFEGLDVSAL